MTASTLHPKKILLLFALLLAAANMRIGTSSFSPLLPEIEPALGLGDAETGLLNALPYLLFSLVALLARPGRGPSLEKKLTLALLFICIGTALRPWAGPALLFGGTIVLSIGIAMGNVLLPPLVKRSFPRHLALVGTAYPTLMTLAAALSSGLAVELAQWGALHFPLSLHEPASQAALSPGPAATPLHPLSQPLNWRFSMAVWAIPAAAALLLWLPLLGCRAGAPVPGNSADCADCENKSNSDNPGSSGRPRSMWKSPLAWQLGLFLAFVTAGGSAAFTWLPEMLESRGISQEEGGWMLALYQLVSLIAGIALPALISRLKSQSGLALATGLVCALGTLGLWLRLEPVWLWVALTGLGNGAGFILALAFIGLRARNHRDAASLSGMVQAVGYLWGAFTPPLLGLIFHLDNSWNIPLLILIIAALAQAAFGAKAGKNMYA